MTYDNTDTNADGAIDAPVDNDSVSTANVNNEVYASQFDGTGLASKVENALLWLRDNTGGQGRVRVTPKDDGTAWTWDKELVLDLADLSGAHIDIDDHTKIDHVHLNGNEWCLRTGGNFQYVSLINPVFQPNEQDATAVILDAPRHDGTVFVGAKIESPPDPGGITAVDTGPNNDNFYTPLFVGTREMNFGIDTQVGDSGLTVPEVRGAGEELKLGTFGGSDVSIKEDAINAGSLSGISGLTLSGFNSVLDTDSGLLIFQNQGNDIAKLADDGYSEQRWETQDLSGTTGDNTGETRLDDGTNTSHGDPDLCIWNGSEWRQSGTTNTFT